MDAITITEELYNLDNQTLVSKIPALFAQAATIQETLLKQIIANNVSCEWGKKYHFDQIQTIEEYRKLVPITTWEDVKPYSDRMIEDRKSVV